MVQQKLYLADHSPLRPTYTCSCNGKCVSYRITISQQQLRTQHNCPPEPSVTTVMVSIRAASAGRCLCLSCVRGTPCRSPLKITLTVNVISFAVCVPPILDLQLKTGLQQLDVSRTNICNCYIVLMPLVDPSKIALVPEPLVLV